MKVIKLLFLLSLFVGTQDLSAQNLRLAFVLGGDEAQYDALRTDYARTLLTVCKNDQETALTHWFKLLQDLEMYGEKINFDLDGTKLFLNIFWNEDGSIGHIGILPMPSSKNVPKEDLVAFFSSFVRQYSGAKLESDKKYSHYTTVSFPTFARKANG